MPPRAALHANAHHGALPSPQVALKKHITEFLDHHLVRTRSGTGGQQCYWCALPGDTMKAIVQVEGK